MSSHDQSSQEHEYAFDCTLTAAIRVWGTSREAAEAHLRAAMDAADCNAGAWRSGEPILFEASVNGSIPVLYEVDGEPVEDARPRDSLYTVELCIRAAEQHGMEGDADHEAGDLQDGLREMWELLTLEQRDAYMTSETVIARLALGLSSQEMEHLYPESTPAEKPSSSFAGL